MTKEWNSVLAGEFAKPYFKDLHQKVKNEYANHICHPDWNNIFRAFDETNLPDVKVVIIGQDPYHGANQAQGLCFSVNRGVAIPPSLHNIYKELKLEYPNYKIPNHGDLSSWARQGVLLLNATLTVRDGSPNSHKDYGWGFFTDEVIRVLETKDQPIVYLLWGSFAKSKKEFITNPNHLVLETVHPSPMSADRGFFGCNHFNKCNQFLKSKGLTEINWQIPD